MKQYLTTEQTAKLVELGFEKPQTVISYSYPKPSDEQMAYEASLGFEPYIATVDQIEFEYAYSIGELIEMLPPRIKGINLSIDRYYEFEQWFVYWNAGNNNEFFRATELIDALYNAIITLKEEGVI